MRGGARLLAGLIALCALAPAAANAALVADFELNGSLANSAGTAATLTNNGGSLTSSGIKFGINQGPVLSGLGALDAYTIDMTFTLDALNGPRNNGYIKLIDFSGLQSDNGYYSYGGYLNAYPLTNSPAPVFTAGDPVRLTLSRDNTGLITAYINNGLIYSQADSANQSRTLIDGLNPLTFFTDDVATASGEASSGFLDYIRIYDSAITPGAAVGAVPESATWGMLILGCGATGAMMRRKRRAGATLRFT